MGTTGGRGGGDGVDSRQLLLVGICMFGLVAAAFLAPVAGANNPFTLGGSGSDVGGSGGGGGGDGGGEPRERPGDGDGRPIELDEGEDRGEPGDGGDRLEQLQPYDGCFVLLEDEPRPGTETTVLVTVDGDPADDVRVWFNGEYVGRTDTRGVVTGTVPFETDLNVTVESPTDEPCRFASEVPDSAGFVGAGVSAAGATGATVTPEPSGAIPAPQRRQQSDGGANNSSRYDVAANVTIRTSGDAYPGSNVTLVATVAGAPMRNAAVTVDGDRVGETDDDGRYRLSVPDRDSIEVTVSRGEISGETTIDIEDLSVRFAPELLVPGERATVVVTRGDEPVEGATVALDGQRLGTTDQNGTVEMRLGLSGGTVQAGTGSQSATVPVWQAYWVTALSALLLGVLTVTTTVAAAVLRGRRAALRVAFVWCVVWVLFVLYAINGALGYAVTLAGMAVTVLIALIVVLVRYRGTIASGGTTTVGLVAGFFEWCKRMVLRVVSGLEGVTDWLRRGAARLGAWLRSLPTSVSGLAGRLGAWLRGLPGAVARGLGALPLRGLGAAALSVGFVIVATVAFGSVGFIASVALVTLAGLVWWAYRRDSEAADDGDATDQPDPVGSTVDSPAVLTLRQLWRRLASWAMPDSWRTRTPAEVSRAAIDRGLPRGPVERLTEAFRDVEYGGQSEESRNEQARTAFEAIEYHRDTEEEDG